MSYSLPIYLPPTVFRAYDIRGEAGNQGITPNVAYAIGLAIGSKARECGINSLVVGRDARLSGPELKAALIAGLIETGTNVIDVGVVPTPLVYFATHCLSTRSGVMVTASHNPGHHNGFKIVLEGNTLSTEGVKALYQRIVDCHLITNQHQQGTVSHYDIVPDYIAWIRQHILLKKPLKVVVDCGHGVAGVLAPHLYRQLGCEVIELFCDVDGHFPHHHPDPTVPDNLQDLIAVVRKERADIGLAFDGDADRLGVVTDRGEIIWPDRQMMLFSLEVLSHHPGAKIIFDVKCTSLLPKIIQEHGGHPIMCRTGHSILKAKMMQEKAILAGEMSGHIFFKDNWFGFDDGIYVGARLLKILSSEVRSISEIFNALPNRINTPELKLPVLEENKQSLMQCLLHQSDFGVAERITIDGLRIELPYAWGLIRPSNTSPYLILRFEADTEQQLHSIKALFRRELLKIDSKLALPF